METLIKKAIEGGWYECTRTVTQTIEPKKDDVIHMKIEDGKWVFVRRISYKEIVLDQLFWKSLSTVCDWSKIFFCPICGNGIGRDSDEVFQPEYQYYALKFHEINLTESFEKAVEYLLSVTQ